MCVRKLLLATFGLVALMCGAAHASPLRWTRPSLIPHQPPYSSFTPSFTALSCPSTTVCVGADSLGDVVTSHDPSGGVTAWRTTRLASPSLIDGVPDGLSAVSCPSARLCVALDYAYGLVISTNPAGGARTWRAMHLSGVDTDRLSSIACPAVSLCLAVDWGGRMFVSTDPAGGSGTWIASSFPAGMGSISCGSTELCAAISNYGEVYTSSDPAAGGSSWSAQPGVHATAVSCVGGSFCAATNGEQVLSTDDPTGGPAAWNAATIDQPSELGCTKEAGCTTNALTAIGCASSTSCVAVDAAGNLFAADDPSAGAASWHESSPGAGDLTAIACPSTALCVAVDSGGDAVSSVDPTAVAPTWQVSGCWPSIPVIG